MKKNLFDEVVKNEIIERSQQVTELSTRLWGKMQPAEMLRHCSDALLLTLSTPKTIKKSTTRQRVLKFMMLNFISRFPMKAKAPRQLDMLRNPALELNIEEEKKRFAENINRFYNHKDVIQTTHPYFGNMNKKQWGILTWMHMDHHLRQFGV